MDIRFQFMKYRKIAGLISIFLFTISVLSLSFRGLSLGLDFSGGTLVEVTYETPVDLEIIRDTLKDNGFEDSQVINFGTNLDVLIKEKTGLPVAIAEDIFDGWSFAGETSFLSARYPAEGGGATAQGSWQDDNGAAIGSKHYFMHDFLDFYHDFIYDIPCVGVIFDFKGDF